MISCLPGQCSVRLKSFVEFGSREHLLAHGTSLSGSRTCSPREATPPSPCVSTRNRCLSGLSVCLLSPRPASRLRSLPHLKSCSVIMIVSDGGSGAAGVKHQPHEVHLQRCQCRPLHTGDHRSRRLLDCDHHCLLGYCHGAASSLAASHLPSGCIILITKRVSWLQFEERREGSEAQALTKRCQISLSLALSFALSLALSHTRSLALALSLHLSLSLSLARSLARSLSFSLSFSWTLYEGPQTGSRQEHRVCRMWENCDDSPLS